MHIYSSLIRLGQQCQTALFSFSCCCASFVRERESYCTTIVTSRNIDLSCWIFACICQMKHKKVVSSKLTKKTRESSVFSSLLKKPWVFYALFFQSKWNDKKTQFAAMLRANFPSTSFSSKLFFKMCTSDLKVKAFTWRFPVHFFAWK